MVRTAMKCSGVVKRRKSASARRAGRPIVAANICSNSENGIFDSVMPPSIIRRASLLATSCAWRNEIASVRTSESASSASVMPASSMWRRTFAPSIVAASSKPPRSDMNRCAVSNAS